MSNKTNLKIGELAKQTNLTVGTLRYYSDIGLLQPVQRGDNGYRYYSQDASKQVEFIKKAEATPRRRKTQGNAPQASSGDRI